MRFYILISMIVLAAGCSSSPPASNGNAANQPAVNSNNTVASISTYQIVNTFPHDPKAFTQGLDFHDGFLYEGTGGKTGDDFFSSLRKVQIDNGKVLQKYDLPREFFGEGVAVMNGKIYQLTWRERTGFVYNLDDFKLLREVRYSGEGWGLTHDNTHLYMSDGTHVIRVVDPETFQTVRTIVVMDEKGRPMMDLNELEYVNGEIWANVWQTGWIVRIDPQTGKLIGRIDLRDLAEREIESTNDADVLNGIAYDEATGRIFVTGKNWKRLFEIKVNLK